MSEADKRTRPFSFDDHRDWPEDDEQAARRKSKLKKELKEIILRLQGCCLLPVKATESVKATKFVWPKESDLKRMSEIVHELRGLVRKKVLKQGARLKKPWDNFKKVDREMEGLHLCKSVGKLLSRARDNTPFRPFEILNSYASGEGKLVSEFFDKQSRLNRRVIEPNEVEWEIFTPLFLKLRNEQKPKGRRMVTLETAIRDQPGSSKLKAYTVFLELQNEDAKWTRQHGQSAFKLVSWVYCLQAVDLLKIVQRFSVPVNLALDAEETFKKLRNEHKKHMATQRKKRSRAKAVKKIPSKSVT